MLILGYAFKIALLELIRIILSASLAPTAATIVLIRLFALFAPIPPSFMGAVAMLIATPSLNSMIFRIGLAFYVQMVAIDAMD